jgi:heat shock protein 4
MMEEQDNSGGGGGGGGDGADVVMHVVDSPPPKKVVYKKRNLELIISKSAGGLSPDEFRIAVEKEAEMAYEDRLIVETAEKRNELESYLYTLRNKLDGPLKDFTSDQEMDTLKAIITQAEEWLYNDGFDSTKDAYIKKIEEIKARGDLAEFRYNESRTRNNALDQLQRQLDLCKSFANKYDEAHSHITEEDREKIRSEVAKTEKWMVEATQLQNSLQLFAEPVLTTEQISKQRNALFLASNAIMQKKKNGSG